MARTKTNACRPRRPEGPRKQLRRNRTDRASNSHEAFSVNTTDLRPFSPNTDIIINSMETPTTSLVFTPTATQDVPATSLSACESIVCEICTEPVENIGSLVCKHKFCYPCISAWVVINNTCPICRIKINCIICDGMEHSVQDTQEQTSTPPPPPPNALMRRFNSGLYELNDFVVPDDEPIVFYLTNVEGSDARRSRSPRSQGQSRIRRRPSELNEYRVRQRLR